MKNFLLIVAALFVITACEKEVPVEIHEEPSYEYFNPNVELEEIKVSFTQDLIDSIQNRLKLDIPKHNQALVEYYQEQELKSPPKLIDPDFVVTLDKLEVFNKSVSGDIVILKTGVDVFGNGFLYPPDTPMVSVNIWLNNGPGFTTSIISDESIIITQPSDIGNSYPVAFSMPSAPIGFDSNTWKWRVDNMGAGGVITSSIVFMSPPAGTYEHFSSVAMGCTYVQSHANNFDNDCTNNRRRIVVALTD